MNRDPFDSLRARNPVRPESLPDAPMTLATRITAGRPTLRRGLAIAGATAVAVLAAGSAWLLWTSGGGRETAIEVTTTTSVEVSTTTIGTAEEDAPILVVYFLDSDTNTLVPVARDLRVLDVRPLPDLGPLAVELLLSGPGAWDAAPLDAPVAAAEAGLTSAIPEGTALLSFALADGTATVDLSAEFLSGDPAARATRFAQLVFTVTRLEAVQNVQVLVAGSPASPLDGDPGPLTWQDVDSLAPPVLIAYPPLGGTLQLPDIIVAASGRLALTLIDGDGTELWNATVVGGTDCCAAAEVPGDLVDYGRWVTLQAAGTEGGVTGASFEMPIWLAPYVPPADEPGIPEATTTTTTPADGKAPWSAAPLAADAVPTVVADTWSAADNRDECAVLFPADPGALAGDAVLHDRYFGGGWGLAWDLPSGPGRWDPGGEYCADCGREAFGVAGTGGDATGTEDAIWPNRLAWTDGSHAGYGYEGLTSGGSGEPLLAYLFIEGQGCMYNVWSYLGEEHLLALLDQLRFVAATGTDGLGALRAFPQDLLFGCAADTVRDPAAFEAALADGPISLASLCALVGLPDYETGSGLFIPAYDLADGSRLYLGYTTPWGDGLIYANLVSPGGEVRNLLGE